MVEQEFYSLERNAAETERLNAQNILLIRAVGYILHPTIKAQLPSEPRIAELATGTGAWLVDLSTELSPNAQYHGYDITDTAFLGPSRRPSNVTLTTSDCKQPAPTELHGKYDVVNIRFLNVALRPGREDWAAIATHAYQLLKPGGALQWIEGNFHQLTSVYQTRPDTVTAALEKSVAQASPVIQKCDWFVGNLRHVLTSIGFDGNVRQYIVSTDREVELRKPMSQVGMGALYGILLHSALSGQEGAWSAEEVEAAKEEMGKEIDGGAYLRVDLHQFVAFKKA